MDDAHAGNSAAGKDGGTARRAPGDVAAGSGRPLLEEVLAAHVRGLARGRLDGAQLDALLDRLGLRGRPPCTLASAAGAAGVSGERVRQIEARLRAEADRVSRPPDLPELDDALALVARALPLPAADVPGLLVDAGVTAGAFSLESLQCAAALLGRSAPFVLYGSGAGAMVLPRAAEHAVAHSERMKRVARKMVERSGAAMLHDLERELADEGVGITRRHLRTVLAGCTTALVRDDGWFWFGDPPCDGPFIRATMRMLAVADPLPLAGVREGLKRHNAFRRIAVLPPLRVLADVYASNPALHVEHGTLSALEPVPPEAMGEVNRRIVDILRAAPDGMMTRCELFAACHQAGLNLATVSLYTCYSECLERVAPGVFAPRGTVVDAEALRERRRGRKPTRRGEDASVWGWTPEGRIWLEVCLTATSWASGVLHVPRDVLPVLAGRRFGIHHGDEAGATTLGVDDHGNSWGWTAFLRRVGAEPGDVVRAEIDLDAGVARLERHSEERASRPGRPRP